MPAPNQIVFGTGEDDFFDFDAARGNPQPKQRQLDVIVEPGYAGEILRNTGVRAAPTELVTRRYVEDREAGIALIEAYHAINNGAPCELILHDESYGYFRVITISPAEPRACQSAIGTIETDPTACVECVWTLIGTTPPPEPDP